MDQLTDLIDRYIAVWNETDPAVRRDLIARTWTPTALYRDPVQEGDGRDGIDAMIRTVQERFAGHRFRRTGDLGLAPRSRAVPLGTCARGRRSGRGRHRCRADRRRPFAGSDRVLRHRSAAGLNTTGGLAVCSPPGLACRPRPGYRRCAWPASRSCFPRTTVSASWPSSSTALPRSRTAIGCFTGATMVPPMPRGG